jgi:DNA-binding beta-propeller fold protein YncE
VAAFRRNTTTGGLTQLLGTAGCTSEAGVGENCAAGKALLGAASVTVSANGTNVYVASQLSDAIAAFHRTGHGQLGQLAGTAGCVSETGTGGDCADGRALDGAQAVAVSPDGAHVYVGAQTSDAITGFARSATNGALSQLAGMAGCITETSTPRCADGRGLDGPASVAVSGDGAHV